MNERVYIKEELKEIFRGMGCGLVDYIEVYRVESNKYFFRAGPGRFHLTKEDLQYYKLG
jgi:hypothetical protein